MRSTSLAGVSDRILLQDLRALVAKSNFLTAELLTHLAEVDRRRLYAPAGYPSFFAWCVGELRMSEDAAAKRIRAARTAREHPELLPAVADGRLHLSAVVLLAPYLTRANVAELLAAATHRTKAEIERELSRRFPQPDLPTVVMRPSAITGTERAAGLEGLLGPAGTSGAAAAPGLLGAPGHAQAPATACETSSQQAPGPVGMSVSQQVTSPPSNPQLLRARLSPLSPGRVGLQLTISEATHEKLRYAQALLGHAVPSGDVAQVLDRALDALIATLECGKFAKRSRAVATRPSRGAAKDARPSREASSDPRHLPAHVRRDVWLRDGGRCTFVGDGGHRCESRTRLEFDHVTPVARGGGSTVANLRLRCRVHNQLEAERALGRGLMDAKRVSGPERSSEGRTLPVPPG